MSGYKCSEFRLQLEQEEKLRRVQEVQRLHAELLGTRERLRQVLAEASEGLRRTFATETDGAQRWQEEIEIPAIDGVNMDADFNDIWRTQEALEDKARVGQQYLQAVTVAFTQRKDELGSFLTRKAAEVEGHLLAVQGTVQTWLGEEVVSGWQHRLQHIRQSLTGEQYTGLDTALDQLDEQLAEGSRQAQQREDKQQKRLYLLKALRQVCGEMGFEEITAPHYEHEGDRGSRILFSVDTIDRGQIDFTLTLDGVSTFSEIADNHCFEEFDQLSQFLEDEFGIETSFTMADGQPIPRLLRKGEKDLPDDNSRSLTLG